MTNNFRDVSSMVDTIIRYREIAQEVRAEFMAIEDMEDDKAHEVTVTMCPPMQVVKVNEVKGIVEDWSGRE